MRLLCECLSAAFVQWGRYLWMHNGVVGGFMAVRRAMLAALSDGAYNTVQSFHSDSAVAFALFLNHLPDLNSQLQPSQLLRAMEVRTACRSQIMQPKRRHMWAIANHWALLGRMRIRCLALPRVSTAGEHVAAKQGIWEACGCSKRSSVSNLLACGAVAGHLSAR